MFFYLLKNYKTSNNKKNINKAVNIKIEATK